MIIPLLLVLSSIGILSTETVLEKHFNKNLKVSRINHPLKFGGNTKFKFMDCDKEKKAVRINYKTYEDFPRINKEKLIEFSIATCNLYFSEKEEVPANTMQELNDYLESDEHHFFNRSI